jgi:RimJ/RimL family protein N-acetyltransferase
MMWMASPSTPTLHDGVVTLNTHTGADVDDLLAGEDDEHARRFGWYPGRSTRTSAAQSIRRWRREWRVSGTTRGFAVRESTSGQLAGGCELRVLEDAAAAISYWIFPQFRGRGYACRAVELATSWATADLGIRRFVLEIEPDNLASLGVARHARFSETGIGWDDHGRRILTFERRADRLSI